MKAILVNGAGGTEQLQYADIAMPEPKGGELRIRVSALSINPVDIKTRKGGAFLSKLQAEPPVILGWDVSGVVDAVGANANEFAVGDEVFGMVNFPGAGRAYAEYVVAPQEHFARKPANLSHEAAAAATLAALTAWQVLVEQAKIAAGQTVLVHAAAGGVGHFAVQIAKHFGATVIGTASLENHEFLQRIGVDRAIDYRAQDFREGLSGVDIVLDPIGGDTTAQSLDVLRPGGIVISIVGGAKEPVVQAAAERGLRAANYLVHSSGDDMKALAGILQKGIIVPEIAQVFPFEQMAAAHAQIETGRTRGKVVVVV